MRTSQRATRASSAVAVYVIILVAFQVFLLTVAVEALATDDITTFQSSADDLTTTFQDEVDKVAESFSEIDTKYPSQELSDEINSACAF